MMLLISFVFSRRRKHSIVCLYLSSCHYILHFRRLFVFLPYHLNIKCQHMSICIFRSVCVSFHLFFNHALARAVLQIYRVFIKYCVFPKILEYFGTLAFFFPWCQCVYTHKAGRTPALQQNHTMSWSIDAPAH